MFCQLFDSYYPSRFPTLWEQYDELVANDNITSTREVRREIENHRVSTLRDRTNENREVFPAPNADEALVVNRIFSVANFQQVIERRKLQKGGLNADPFRASIFPYPAGIPLGTKSTYGAAGNEAAWGGSFCMPTE